MLQAFALICAGAQSIDQNKLLAIAHQAIEREVRCELSQGYGTQTPARPVFVTIELNGVVLGCRGSLLARSTCLEEEVAQDARAACAHDPRYRPLTLADLDRILVTVTVVSDQQPIASVEGLTPAEGLVLVSGSRTGVVLPWEGKDPRTRLDWAYRKAGVPKGSPVTLYRMTAERFRG